MYHSRHRKNLGTFADNHYANLILRDRDAWLKYLELANEMRASSRIQAGIAFSERNDQ